MKRSLALAVCGFSLVLALVGGWLADRQFTAALDTLRTALAARPCWCLAPVPAWRRKPGAMLWPPPRRTALFQPISAQNSASRITHFLPTASGLKSWTLLPCPALFVLTSNLRPLPQGALAVNYDRLAAPDVQNASLGSNSVLMLLRLLRLCGAKAVLLAGPMATSRYPRLCR